MITDFVSKLLSRPNLSLITHLQRYRLYIVVSACLATKGNERELLAFVRPQLNEKIDLSLALARKVLPYFPVPRRKRCYSFEASKATWFRTRCLAQQVTKEIVPAIAGRCGSGGAPDICSNHNRSANKPRPVREAAYRMTIPQRRAAADPLPHTPSTAAR